MEKTRVLFVKRCRHYLGVPYRKGAMRKEGQKVGAGALKHPKLTLDCCGLVRQCARDLRTRLGFRLGPHNQAYQIDTLPIVLEEKDLRPGDLVFIEGRYHRPRKTRPTHDILHVEIFVGGETGMGTIGARSRSGAVNEFQR